DTGVVQLTFTAPVCGKAEVVVVTASVGQVNAADIGNLVVDHNHFLVVREKGTQLIHIALLYGGHAPDLALLQTSIEQKAGQHGFKVAGVHAGFGRQPGHQVDVRFLVLAQRCGEAVPQTPVAIEPHLVVDLPATDVNRVPGIADR